MTLLLLVSLTTPFMQKRLTYDIAGRDSGLNDLLSPSHTCRLRIAAVFAMARAILGVAARATVRSRVAAEVPLGAAGSKEGTMAGKAGAWVSRCVPDQGVGKTYLVSEPQRPLGEIVAP
jgi:hypothetical protein